MSTYAEPKRTTRTCSDCGISINGYGRCIDCYQATRGIGHVSQCSWCGRSTVAKGKVCQDCMRLAKIPEPTEKDALPPGRWVRGPGGVQRYVTVEQDIAAYEAQHGERLRRRLRSLIAERYDLAALEQEAS